MVEFDIEHVKLQNGNHQFSYELDKQFFDFFENTEVLSVAVKSNVQIDKSDNMAIVDIDTSGELMLNCDRCLEALKYPVKTRFKVIYHLNSEFSKSNEAEEVGLDVVYLTANEFKFNIAKSIYESFLPAIPMVKNCDGTAEKPCNVEILKHLDNSQRSNDSVENKTNDPRWDELKKLLNNK